MLTQKQILDYVKEYGSNCIDSRDLSRLCKYFPISDWDTFGFKLADGATAPKVIDYTEESILKDLKNDLDFAFEKALNKRGISSSLMYEVIKMWMFILEDLNLKDPTYEDYAMYGLPFYKTVALKYGFDNPIGDDSGSEDKYNEEY